MADNFTYHIILDGEGNITDSGISNPSNPEQPGKPNAENPAKPKGSLKQAAGLATAAYVGKQVATYATSHVQMFTGSSHRQAQMNDALKLGGFGVAFMANPALGAATVAISAATTALDNQYKAARERVALEELQRRAGVTYNRSRSK